MSLRKAWRRFSEVLDKIVGANDLNDFLDKMEAKNAARRRKSTLLVAAEHYGPQSAYCKCGPQAPQGPLNCGPGCRYASPQGSQRAYSFDPPREFPVDPATVDPVVKDWYFNEYQEEALKTAQCPLIGHPVIYPFLGVAGEVGEVYEKLSGYIHKDMSLVWKYPTRGEIIKELGDVMWYVAVMADRLGLKMEEITSGPDGIPRENSLKYFAMLTHKDGLCRSSSHDIQLSLDKLAIAQGRLSERLKKVFRDGSGQIEGERRDTIIHELSELLWALASLCLVMRINMSLVAHTNIEKLRSRRERNTIQGEGDNR